MYIEQFILLPAIACQVQKGIFYVPRLGTGDNTVILGYEPIEPNGDSCHEWRLQSEIKMDSDFYVNVGMMLDYIKRNPAPVEWPIYLSDTY